MARNYKAKALVLGKTKLGESDLILTLLSSDNYQIRAVAKGARKPGSRLCGLSEPFTILEAKLHKGKTLDIISEAKSVQTYSGIRGDYDRLLSGSVVLEMVGQITNDGDDISRLYAMTCAFLGALDGAPSERIPLLTSAFLLKALAMTGYSPEHELCAKNENLSNLFRSTFVEVLDSKLGQAEDTRRQIADLRQLIAFMELHFPVRIRALSGYRKSLTVI